MLDMKIRSNHKSAIRLSQSGNLQSGEFGGPAYPQACLPTEGWNVKGKIKFGVPGTQRNKICDLSRTAKMMRTIV